MDKILSSILGVVLLFGPSFPREKSPEWATDAWIREAAHIVAGEATPYIQSKYLVACTILNDIEEKDYHPWGLRRGRWFGYGHPSPLDYIVVRKVLNGECKNIPHYDYLGNGNDLVIWKNIGMVDNEDRIDTYHFGGWTMVGIIKDPKIKFNSKVVLE